MDKSIGSLWIIKMIRTDLSGLVWLVFQLEKDVTAANARENQNYKSNYNEAGIQQPEGELV